MVLLYNSAYAGSNDLTSCLNGKVNSITGSKQFPIAISIDNQLIPLLYSQNIATDIALSTMNGLAFISHKYGWYSRVIGTLANTVCAYYIALLHHEITGHGLKGQEFGAKIEAIHIGFFRGWTRNAYKSCIIQEHDIFTINGNQANTVLAEKITSQLLQNRQAICPFIAATYIFSAYNQFYYIWRYPRPDIPCDMKQHIEMMHLVYGRASVTASKIKSLAYLDLLNPMLLSSLYSILSRSDVRVPTYRLGILPGLGATGIMPLARLMLTPYNVLEKRFIVYIDAAYSPIKIEFGFGKELKSEDPVQESNAYPLDAYGRFINQDQTNPKKSYTYYGGLEVNRLISIGKIKVGCILAAWRQPELFVEHPIHAQLKNGGMGALNLTYEVNERLSMVAEMRYKSKGFLIGRPVKASVLVSLTGQWML